MRFRFQRILRKYEVPYTLIRHGKGHYDSVGVYHPPEAIRTALRGSVQPLGDRLMQIEGGRYHEDDRMLITVYPHKDGDIIEHQGRQYTIDMDHNWTAYSDVSEYRMKRVSTHDPV
ncbi:hypothetical protein [Paenibacillus spongiae]|uniref:Uncharacterized protein n=1 Tax=Paenibacillus spongiae TaxID=2909671 RepID=A0ABY5S2Q0_9BACL|nr:hypothetical protein [Paenibacillus spongiae]UVI28171.1 hypothetical protein L1F29_22295 [Paenibacillus spongiae]